MPNAAPDEPLALARRFRVELVEQNARAWSTLWPLTGHKPGAPELREELELAQRRLVAALDELGEVLRTLGRRRDTWADRHDQAVALVRYVAEVLPPHDRAVRDRVLVQLADRLPPERWEDLLATLLRTSTAPGPRED